MRIAPRPLCAPRILTGDPVPLISPESVESVRQGADLVELVRGRVDLVRRGGRWWGRCPFHDERTPSFSLLPPDFRRYYCHGCGATGDAISWMREREGSATFAEAVEGLAERFGIPLRFEEETPVDAARREAAERRRRLLDRAAAFYSEYLWRAGEAAPAREYLAGRGFDEALVRRFNIGYAPGGGAVLSGRAIREGFSRAELVEAGLARMRGGQAADFFASRIVFPIADGQGRVQGFGARTLDPAERAKYVNSPEGEHFRKRTLLFGLAEARTAAAKKGYFVVAEGYTDVMGLVASGVEEAVACMGTSLTSEQLKLLRRYAGRGAPVVRRRPRRRAGRVAHRGGRPGHHPLALGRPAAVRARSRRPGRGRGGSPGTKGCCGLFRTSGNFPHPFARGACGPVSQGSGAGLGGDCAAPSPVPG